MTVQKATKDQLTEILSVFDAARRFMRQNGNPSQWTGGYPQKGIIEKDIEDGVLYTVTNNGEIVGVFVFFVGEDETYKKIDGEWKDVTTPYGVMHKVASNGKARGVFGCALEFCKKSTLNIRIDTHEDNKKMQEVLEKNGFSRCGIIITHNGTPRIAYQS